MTTRFRPTPWADLHLGHVWCAWHNWYIAHATGGDFILLIDDFTFDLQEMGLRAFPVTVNAARYTEDLAWLGMPPDTVAFASQFDDAHAAAAKRLGIKPTVKDFASPIQFNTIHGGMPGMGGGQYTDYLVACRAVDDHELGVHCFVRGDDLAGEVQLYDSIARRLGYNPPGQQYVKCVWREGQLGKESKSGYSPTVRQLREAGYQPHELIETLRECALRSEEAQLHCVRIPKGVAEAGEVKWLPFSGYGKSIRDHLEAAKGEPWEEDARRACLAVRRSLRGADGTLTGSSILDGQGE
jgi:glutamyl/glutaminyl-tRNA synthetase